MLSKHAERCRFPHGHSRTVELVLCANELDENDMVCDFKWVKLAVAEFLDQFDHALCVNAADPHLPRLREVGERIVVFDEGDPTTELMARRIFDHVKNALGTARPFETAGGAQYQVRNNVRLERVRVWETSSSWAEYTEGDTA